VIPVRRRKQKKIYRSVAVTTTRERTNENNKNFEKNLGIVIFFVGVV
jgi:hypothetical protein